MKKRILYFDALNICAAFGVIFLHCNGLAHTYSNTLGWKQAMLVEVAFYWAVPIFFMLSGATLMEYRNRYTTAEFFKKRFLRTVIPFIAWSLINAVVKHINPLEIGFREFFDRFFHTTLENVYWFFIPLFAVYLSMPVLSLLKDNRRILLYMVTGSFLLSSTLPHLFTYVGLQWNGALQMLTAGGYLLFVLLGYLLATAELSRKQRLVLYALGVFGAALRYTATLLLSARDGALNRTFFSYTAYFSVFLAVAVFVFFKHLPLLRWIEQKPRLVTVIKEISGCSFGVYLVHMIVIRYVGKVLPSNCWEWRLLVPFLIYAISLLVTYVLKKIPLAKHIVP